jgi:ornithine cyclodeaminase/alanine dehydrogenase-like protein (mu-crystallin family)
MRDHVRAGTFVAAIGADNPLKQELDTGLLASNKVVVDVLEQCAAIGDLHHAIVAGVMGKSDVYAELGAIVAGRTPGRTSAEEIIIFDSTGTALQDTAAASIVYEKALSSGKGAWLNLAD